MTHCGHYILYVKHRAVLHAAAADELHAAFQDSKILLVKAALPMVYISPVQSIGPAQSAIDCTQQPAWRYQQGGFDKRLWASTGQPPC